MAKHTHNFVNEYDAGMMAFGLDRETDESSLVAYLQKLTDDDLMSVLVGRLSDEEILSTMDFAGKLLRKHLSEAEYHRLFLKEEPHS
jgi:hypothetical protein